jgi:hypothetical protein
MAFRYLGTLQSQKHAPLRLGATRYLVFAVTCAFGGTVLPDILGGIC